MIEQGGLSLPVLHHDVGSGCLLQELLDSWIEDSAFLRRNRFEWPESEVLLALDIVFCGHVTVAILLEVDVLVI